MLALTECLVLDNESAERIFSSGALFSIDYRSKILYEKEVFWYCRVFVLKSYI